MFVNREDKLQRSERWWQTERAGSLGIIWGMRRVGKTELIRHFVEGRRTIFHGEPWGEAFRLHLRFLADQDHLDEDIIAIGPFWTAAGEEGQLEIDSVALAGPDRATILLGEAKWARWVDGPESTGIWNRRRARSRRGICTPLRNCRSRGNHQRSTQPRAMARDIFAS
jgi:hypothetical protein